MSEPARPTRDWPSFARNDGRVGVVLVGCNTRTVTAQAIYSLFSTISRPAFRLVVVDNASTDGSAQLLGALGRSEGPSRVLGTVGPA